MAKGWNCARCGTENPETSLTCSNCRLIRGAVWVPTNQSQQPAAPDQAFAWGGGAQPANDSSPAGVQPDLSAWSAGSQPAPAVRAGLLQMIPLNWIVIGVVALATVAGGWYFSAGRGASGEINKEGDLQATELRVGDCFDLKDPDAEELDDVAARPCTTEHEFELYYALTLPAGPYPTDAVFDTYFETQCIPNFATYIGKAYQDSALDVYWLVPTQVGWDEGDRSIQCAVYSPNQSRLTYSLKGSGF